MDSLSDNEYKKYLDLIRNKNIRLADVPEEFRNDELCIEAANSNIENINNIPWRLIAEVLTTEEKCLASVSIDGELLKYVPDYLKSESVCITAASNNIKAVKYVPDEIKTEEMCLAAVQDNYWFIEEVPDSLKTEEMCFIALEGSSGFGHMGDNIPDNLKNSEGMWLMFAKYYPIELKSFPESFQNNSMWFAAAQQNFLALKFVPDEFITEKMCIEAVRNNLKALAYVPNRFKTEAVCLAAISKKFWTQKEFEGIKFKNH